jgi:hypothetical protein
LKNRKFLFSLFLAIFIFALVYAAIPYTSAYAACGIPGAPPCQPPSGGGGGGGGGKKKPAVPPRNTPTPINSDTPTPTISGPAWTQTAIAGVNQVATQLCSAYLTATPVSVVNWYPCGTPTPHVFIPPVDGPNFLLPGVINISIGVLIIIICFGGGFLLIRRGFKSPSPNRPPGPPIDVANQFLKFDDAQGVADGTSKGVADGSNQFAKIELPPGPPTDAANQFQKADDGLNQFQKGDGTNQGGGEQL